MIGRSCSSLSVSVFKIPLLSPSLRLMAGKIMQSLVGHHKRINGKELTKVGFPAGKIFLDR